MASSVSVLAPNGRRQTVKCTPNTTIMQIIEEVCKKQGFNSEDYDIKHHNKVLDTTSTFRFSGLPNNAQLELAAATKARVDSEVILAVNLENGSRLMGQFMPDDSLYNVLQKLCPELVSNCENLVVIYTRREIYGDDLHKTTLRNLGLRGGRAMLRLVQKSPAELKVQANVSAPLATKPVEEKPFRRVFKTDEPLPGSSRQNSREEQPPQATSKKPQKKVELDYMKMAREKRKLAATSPVSKIENDKKLPKTDDSEAMDVEMDKSPCASPASRDHSKSPSPAPLPKIEEFIFLGERNAMLFSLESAKKIPSDELPDEFFDLTIDDAKKLMYDFKRNRSQMENGMLMTSDMRNLEESKKQLRQLNKYKRSVIRIQFPNRIILQGTFTPVESIGDVMVFVRQFLDNTSVDFYLYSTPPKQILLESSKLIEVNCVPCALLHLGCKNVNNLSDIRVKPEFQNQITTNSVASLAASRMRQDSTRTIDFNNEVESMDDESDVATASGVSQPGPSNDADMYERKIIRSTEKVPKWFKPTK